VGLSPRIATLGERQFPPVATSVAGARRFVAEVLAGAPRDLLEDVLLIVSELATNCVVHARSPFDLRIAASDDQLRIQVADRSQTIPTLREPTGDEPRGRGLFIATVLSASWGVERRGVDGKTVWFTVPLRPSGHELIR
jgi:anti-sigma regulatory factor (Ser/Thr protein kinase)